MTKLSSDFLLLYLIEPSEYFSQAPWFLSVQAKWHSEKILPIIATYTILTTLYNRLWLEITILHPASKVLSHALGKNISQYINLGPQLKDKDGKSGFL